MEEQADMFMLGGLEEQLERMSEATLRRHIHNALEVAARKAQAVGHLWMLVGGQWKVKGDCTPDLRAVFNYIVEIVAEAKAMFTRTDENALQEPADLEKLVPAKHVETHPLVAILLPDTFNADGKRVSRTTAVKDAKVVPTWWPLTPDRYAVRAQQLTLKELFQVLNALFKHFGEDRQTIRKWRTQLFERFKEQPLANGVGLPAGLIFLLDKLEAEAPGAANAEHEAAPVARQPGPVAQPGVAVGVSLGGGGSGHASRRPQPANLMVTGTASLKRSRSNTEWMEPRGPPPGVFLGASAGGTGESCGLHSPGNTSPTSGGASRVTFEAGGFGNEAGGNRHLPSPDRHLPSPDTGGAALHAEDILRADGLDVDATDLSLSEWGVSPANTGYLLVPSALFSALLSQATSRDGNVIMDDACPGEEAGREGLPGFTGQLAIPEGAFDFSGAAQPVQTEPPSPELLHPVRPESRLGPLLFRSNSESHAAFYPGGLERAVSEALPFPLATVPGTAFAGAVDETAPGAVPGLPHRLSREAAAQTSFAHIQNEAPLEAIPYAAPVAWPDWRFGDEAGGSVAQQFHPQRDSYFAAYPEFYGEPGGQFYPGQRPQLERLNGRNARQMPELSLAEEVVYRSQGQLRASPQPSAALAPSANLGPYTPRTTGFTSRLANLTARRTSPGKPSSNPQFTTRSLEASSKAGKSPSQKDATTPRSLISTGLFRRGFAFFSPKKGVPLRQNSAKGWVIRRQRSLKAATNAAHVEFPPPLKVTLSAPAGAEYLRQDDVTVLRRSNSDRQRRRRPGRTSRGGSIPVTDEPGTPPGWESIPYGAQLEDTECEAFPVLREFESSESFKSKISFEERECAVESEECESFPSSRPGRSELGAKPAGVNGQGAAGVPDDVASGVNGHMEEASAALERRLRSLRLSRDVPVPTAPVHSPSRDAAVRARGPTGGPPAEVSNLESEDRVASGTAQKRNSACRGQAVDSHFGADSAVDPNSGGETDGADALPLEDKMNVREDVARQDRIPAVNRNRGDASTLPDAPSFTFRPVRTDAGQRSSVALDVAALPGLNKTADGPSDTCHMHRSPDTRPAADICTLLSGGIPDTPGSEVSSSDTWRSDSPSSLDRKDSPVSVIPGTQKVSFEAPVGKLSLGEGPLIAAAEGIAVSA